MDWKFCDYLILNKNFESAEFIYFIKHIYH